MSGKCFFRSGDVNPDLSVSRSAAYLASACVYWRFLGDQLNPLIRPLMDALKKESDLLIQVTNR